MVWVDLELELFLSSPITRAKKVKACYREPKRNPKIVKLLLLAK